MGQCAYSQHALNIGRVLDDPNYAQVDHALPILPQHDDSKNNKVLRLLTRGAEQGNRTPYST